MHIIVTILIGLAVGIVAKLLMPGRDPGGFIITTLLGIAGAFIARFLGERLGWYGPTDAVGFIASVIGSMILLLIYRLLFRRKTLARPECARHCDSGRRRLLAPFYFSTRTLQRH